MPLSLNEGFVVFDLAYMPHFLTHFKFRPLVTNIFVVILIRNRGDGQASLAVGFKINMAVN
jgi:hypothetical protein